MVRIPFPLMSEYCCYRIRFESNATCVAQGIPFKKWTGSKWSSQTTISPKRVFLKRELFPGCVATVLQVVYVARLSQAGIQKVLKALLYATQCDNTAESKWICAKCVAFLSHVYFPLRVPFNESLHQADWKETWPQRQTELSVFTMERIKTPSIR